MGMGGADGGKGPALKRDDTVTVGRAGRSAVRLSELPEGMREECAVFDVDGDGYIHPVEFARAVEAYGAQQSRARRATLAAVALLLLLGLQLCAVVGLTYAVVEATKETHTSETDGIMAVKGHPETTVRVALSKRELNGISSEMGDEFFEELTKFTITQGLTRVSLDVFGYARSPRANSAHGSVITLVTHVGRVVIDGQSVSFVDDLGDFFGQLGFDVDAANRRLVGLLDISGFFAAIPASAYVAYVPEEHGPKPQFPRNYAVDQTLWMPCVTPGGDGADLCAERVCPDDFDPTNFKPEIEEDPCVMQPLPGVRTRADDGARYAVGVAAGSMVSTDLSMSREAWTLPMRNGGAASFVSIMRADRGDGGRKYTFNLLADGGDGADGFLCREYEMTDADLSLTSAVREGAEIAARYDGIVALEGVADAARVFSVVLPDQGDFEWRIYDTAEDMLPEEVFNTATNETDVLEDFYYRVLRLELLVGSTGERLSVWDFDNWQTTGLDWQAVRSGDDASFMPPATCHYGTGDGLAAAETLLTSSSPLPDLHQGVRVKVEEEPPVSGSTRRLHQAGIQRLVDGWTEDALLGDAAAGEGAQRDTDRQLLQALRDGHLDSLLDEPSRRLLATVDWDTVPVGDAGARPDALSQSEHDAQGIASALPSFLQGADEPRESMNWTNLPFRRGLSSSPVPVCAIGADGGAFEYCKNPRNGPQGQAIYLECKLQGEDKSLGIGVGLGEGGVCGIEVKAGKDAGSKGKEEKIFSLGASYEGVMKGDWSNSDSNLIQAEGCVSVKYDVSVADASINLATAQFCLGAGRTYNPEALEGADPSTGCSRPFIQASLGAAIGASGWALIKMEGKVYLRLLLSDDCDQTVRLDPYFKGEVFFPCFMGYCTPVGEMEVHIFPGERGERADGLEIASKASAEAEYERLSKPPREPQYPFACGDGKSSRERFIGYYHDTDESFGRDLCAAAGRAQAPAANGITHGRNDACYVEYEQTSRWSGCYWQSTFVEPMITCNMQCGDGKGSSERYVGRAYSDAECAELVLSRYPHANGATRGGSSCYAEFGMYGRHGGCYWRSCYTGPVSRVIAQVRSEVESAWSTVDSVASSVASSFGGSVASAYSGATSWVSSWFGR